MSDHPHNVATARYLRRRLRRRAVRACCITIFVASVVSSHAGMLGRTGDDWATFNHRTFHVTGVVSGDVLTLATDNGRSQTVKLLGIVAPMGSEKGAAESRCFLTEQALNHNVTLLLPLPQTRDDRGRLLAYVFVDGENLSVAITKAGMAYADRRDRQLMAGLIEPAEAEARKKNRAMWKDLKFDQMPPWRQEWFQTLQRLSRTLK